MLAQQIMHISDLRDSNAWHGPTEEAKNIIIHV